MKFELRQHFQIESARFLPHLPEGHPCRRTHGHSFKIILRLVGERDAKIGWVIDYNVISEKVRPILDKVDHRVLNEVSGLENPTSENLSLWLFTEIKKVLPDLIQVIVAETANTECAYPALN